MASHVLDWIEGGRIKNSIKVVVGKRLPQAALLTLDLGELTGADFHTGTEMAE